MAADMTTAPKVQKLTIRQQSIINLHVFRRRAKAFFTRKMYMNRETIYE